MNTEIIEQIELDLDLGSFVLTGTGINVVQVPEIEDFRGKLALVGRCTQATAWWIGDLANNADDWGDEYVQELDQLGVSYNTIREYARIAKLVSPAIRLADVPWSHHQIVSNLPASDQKEWLAKCKPLAGEKDPRLSKRELKTALEERYGGDEEDIVDEHTKAVEKARAALESLQDFFRGIGREDVLDQLDEVGKVIE